MATKKQKRERLARAEQERREKDHAAKRARTIRALVIGAVAVVVIAVAVIAVRWLSEDKPVVTPKHATEQGGVVYPAQNKTAADAVEVVVYEDPLCPHCRDFEAEHGDFLTDAADRGDITLEYRPIAFISDDSVPPVNAMVCVLDAAGKRAFVEMHDRVFAGEYADADLADLAAESGADGAEVADCIDEGTHDGWIEEVTSLASDAGVEMTPTVLIDG
ncbi:MAG: DsbA family protein, partial [Actinomycetia bacterium]|nr:DsbA family protein [Actinomycetes bacterium]